MSANSMYGMLLEVTCHVDEWMELKKLWDFSMSSKCYWISHWVFAWSISAFHLHHGVYICPLGSEGRECREKQNLGEFLAVFGTY